MSRLIPHRKTRPRIAVWGCRDVYSGASAFHSQISSFFGPKLLQEYCHWPPEEKTSLRAVLKEKTEAPSKKFLPQHGFRGKSKIMNVIIWRTKIMIAIFTQKVQKFGKFWLALVNRATKPSDGRFRKNLDRPAAPSRPMGYSRPRPCFLGAF